MKKLTIALLIISLSPILGLKQNNLKSSPVSKIKDKFNKFKERFNFKNKDNNFDLLDDPTKKSSNLNLNKNNLDAGDMQFNWYKDIIESMN